jgi:hypothetical protein
MAKAKNRAAARKTSSKRGKASGKPTRKKSSKRGKASVKPTRTKVAKRAPPKKPKAKVRRASKSATKPPTEEKRVPEVAETKVPELVPAIKLPEMAVKTTTIDVIEEPAPDVVIVEERKIA